MKILIITQKYHPENVTGALRWTRFVKEFSEKGHHIMVIAGDSKGKLGSFYKDDSTYGEKKVLRVGGVEISRAVWLESKRGGGTLKHINSLKHSVGIFDFANIKKKVLRKMRQFFRLLWTFSYFPGSSWKWGAKVSQIGIKELPDGFSPDVIIASFPNIGCLRAGKLLANNFKIPWIADLRDPISEYQFGVTWVDSVQRPLLRLVEKSLLKSASRVVGINDELLELTASTPRQRISIPNCYVPLNYKQRNLNDNEEVFKIVYTGSITDLTDYPIFLHGLKDYFQKNIRAEKKIEIHYYGNEFHYLLNWSECTEIRGVLIDHGYASRSVILEALSEADLLLAFGWCGPHAGCVATGKIFDYLGSLAPILMVSQRADSKITQIVKEVGAGEILSNSEEVCSFLEDCLSNSWNEIRESLVTKRIESDDGRYEVSTQSANYLDLLRALQI